MTGQKRLRSAAALLLLLALLLTIPAPAAHAEAGRLPVRTEEVEFLALASEEQGENLRVITAYLRDELKLPDSAAAAILANMYRESAFDPRAVDPTGCFFGLCQWCWSRWLSCYLFCQENQLDRFSVEGQLAFLRYELEGEFDWLLNDFLLSAEDSEDGAQDAQYYFCQYFEAPLDPEWEHVVRSKYVANFFWPLLTEGELARPEEDEPVQADPAQTPIPTRTLPDGGGKQQ